jgi:hypothetical protein
MKLYWVNMTYACGGVECDDHNTVIKTAPIFKWMIGNDFNSMMRNSKSKLLEFKMVKSKRTRYTLKPKSLYCKLFNNYRTDGECTEMGCEFCDDFYDKRRKKWWYHPESESYIYESEANLEECSEADSLVDVDHKIKTRVVNIKNHEYDVYCGRGSKFGNPFIIGVHGNREEVIKKFRDYFYSNIELQKKTLKLKDLRLGCYCVPENCHCDVIAEFIENYLK